RLVVETDRGGEAAGESETALTDELLRIARDVRSRQEEQRRQSWSAALAHELAAQGAADVAHAAEQGAVETLLFAPDTAATRESFLIKACAQTAAAVDLVTTDTELPDGVGAVLRYRMTSWSCPPSGAAPSRATRRGRMRNVSRISRGVASVPRARHEDWTEPCLRSCRTTAR